MDKLAQSKQLRSITDAELLVLFDEWLEELDAEVIDCGKRHPGVTARVLARELGLSHRCARLIGIQAQARRQAMAPSQWAPRKKEMNVGTNKSALLALAAVMLTVAFLWLTGNSMAPREATWQDALNEAQSGGYRLISTADLAREYGTRGGALLLVDTRQEWEYRTGHIRGSIPFPIEPTGWSRWRKADALATVLGPDKERLIVFY